jgi:hypothetical protein
MKSERSKQILAIVCTSIVGLVLIVVLALKYLHLKPAQANESPSKLKAFYNTVVESGQSYFSSK